MCHNKCDEIPQKSRKVIVGCLHFFLINNLQREQITNVKPNSIGDSPTSLTRITI